MPATNSSFSIILPSNTPSDQQQNRSNKFVVQLPRKLVFPGSGWVVGLTNIIYPNSWSTIDAVDQQFLYLHLKNGKRYRQQPQQQSYAQEERQRKEREEQLRKEREERQRKEREEQLRKEREERQRKEREERQRKDREEQLRKERKERARKKLEERVSKELEERQRKEREELLRKEREERQRKEREELLRKEREERQRKEREELLRKEREERQRKEREESEAVAAPPPAAAPVSDQHKPVTQTESEIALAGRTRAPYSYLDQVSDHSIYSYVRWPRKGKGAHKLFIYGVDPIPRAHHLSEKDADGHLFAVASEKFAKEFGMQKADRDLLIKIEENIERFEQLYAEAEGAENFAHLSPEEQQQLLHLAHSVRFAWDEDVNRFVFHVFDTEHTGSALVDFVTLSEQIAAVLGFENAEQWIYPNTPAKYPPDMHGGVSHLGIYLNGGVMESMIVGDRQTDLLQMIAVSGQPGEIIERNFQSPLFHPVIAREVNRLSVEIRTTSGRLVPFSFGEVILTLQFTKTISF